YNLALFDLKVLYEIRLIKLLEQKVGLWNMKALRTKDLEEGQRKNVSKQLFQAYDGILACYNIFKDTQQLYRKYRVDRTSRKIIDKDVQSLFLPLNVMQSTTLCPKYRIKNNVIFPNSVFCVNFPLHYVFTSSLLAFFDFNTVYAIRLIQILRVEVSVWNIHVLCHHDLEIGRNYIYSKLFEAYVNIMNCYNIYEACFQLYILYYIIEVFIHSLVYIQLAIFVLQKDLYNDISSATAITMFVISWLFKNYLWQMKLITEHENFYSDVRTVQDTCTNLLRKTSSGKIGDE
ncbi:hypothetical protein HW555_001252, partial [Spodoptera exigua]